MTDTPETLRKEALDTVNEYIEAAKVIYADFAPKMEAVANRITASDMPETFKVAILRDIESRIDEGMAEIAA